MRSFGSDVSLVEFRVFGQPQVEVEVLGGFLFECEVIFEISEGERRSVKGRACAREGRVREGLAMTVQIGCELRAPIREEMRKGNDSRCVIRISGIRRFGMFELVEGRCRWCVFVHLVTVSGIPRRSGVRCEFRRFRRSAVSQGRNVSRPNEAVTTSSKNSLVSDRTE